MMNILEEISIYLQQGRTAKVMETVRTALNDGFSPESILQDGLVAGMNIICEKYKNNEVFVPEALICARSMTKGLDILRPHLRATFSTPIGTVIIGTVKGDLHDIGKNLVGLMMENKGIKVIDLGVNVTTEAFISAAIENKADIIACSALLTTTMYQLGNLVKAVRSSELNGKVKIMIGGAPVSQNYCDEIGADIFTPDASTAAEIAFQICSKS